MNEYLSQEAVQEISPVVLAYIGDAVFELAVRTHIVADGHRKVKDIHLDTVALVKAESQAKVIRQMFDQLSEEEQAIVKRGRNAKSGVPKHAGINDYRMSTGFEALLGFHYLRGDTDRLAYLIKLALAAEKESRNPMRGEP
ncbi:MAG: Mini-ribonuclease 3 [Syntrophomonadaceae bacterium]|nr:Mini-ribonuclease 3 [Syntrophomonadaceae bacterium]